MKWISVWAMPEANFLFWKKKNNIKLASPAKSKINKHKIHVQTCNIYHFCEIIYLKIMYKFVILRYLIRQTNDPFAFLMILNSPERQSDIFYQKFSSYSRDKILHPLWRYIHQRHNQDNVTSSWLYCNNIDGRQRWPNASVLLKSVNQFFAWWQPL